MVVLASVGYLVTTPPPPALTSQDPSGAAQRLDPELRRAPRGLPHQALQKTGYKVFKGAGPKGQPLWIKPI